MRGAAVLLVLGAACWTSAPPKRESVSVNDAPAVPRATCSSDYVSGTIYEAGSDVPMPGVTIVLVGGEGSEDDITDPRGKFSIRRQPTFSKIQLYWLEAAYEAPIPEPSCGLVGRIDPESPGGIMKFERAR